MSKTITVTSNLTNNIQLIRSELDFSQEKFGKSIGATKIMVYNWESNVNNSIKIKYLQAIALLAGVSVEDLSNKKLTAKDIVKSDNNESMDSMLLMAKIQAMNVVILRRLDSIVGLGKSKAKLIEVSRASDDEIETEMKKILKQMKNY